MNIYINPLSDKGAPVLQTKPSGSPISQLRFKRGSSVPLTVTLLGVAEASNLRIGMKRRDRFESPLLVYATAAGANEDEDRMRGLAFRAAEVQMACATALKRTGMERF